MPNWCNNDMIIEGKTEDLNELKEFVKGEKTWFDLEKVIPLTDTKAKAKVLWDKLSSEEQKDRWDNDFDQFWFNVGDGYHWCADNWGTKWNTDCSEPQQTETKLMYAFDTAWSPSEPITKILIKRFPKLHFVHEYEEWGMCFQGILEGKDGIVIKDGCWDVDIAECPDCEITCLSPKEDDEFECTDCGKTFKKTDVDEDDN